VTMAAIMLHRTKYDGAVDVHNRVTLVNDIMNGTNKTLKRRIDCSAAMRWRKQKFEGM